MGRYGRRRLRDLHIWIQYFPAQGSGRVEYILGQFPKARKFFAKMQPRVKVNGVDALSAQPTILDPATHPWMQIAAGFAAFGFWHTCGSADDSLWAIFCSDYCFVHNDSYISICVQNREYNSLAMKELRNMWSVQLSYLPRFFDPCVPVLKEGKCSVFSAICVFLTQHYCTSTTTFGCTQKREGCTFVCSQIAILAETLLSPTTFLHGFLLFAPN